MCNLLWLLLNKQLKSVEATGWQSPPGFRHPIVCPTQRLVVDGSGRRKIPTQSKFYDFV